jgi:hypothetical protein
MYGIQLTEKKDQTSRVTKILFKPCTSQIYKYTFEDGKSVGSQIKRNN